MKHVKALFEVLGRHFDKLAQKNAVVAKPISIGNRHVVPLCEVRVAFGGGGGQGETVTEVDGDETAQSDVGGGAGGSAKTTPVAVLVVSNGKVRVDRVG